MKPSDCAADDFADRGADWTQARDILAAGCEVPPSLEVFEYGLEHRRERSRAPITAQQYARDFADNYRRIR